MKEQKRTCELSEIFPIFPSSLQRDAKKRRDLFEFPALDSSWNSAAEVANKEKLNSVSGSMELLWPGWWALEISRFGLWCYCGRKTKENKSLPLPFLNWLTIYLFYLLKNLRLITGVRTTANSSRAGAKSLWIPYAKAKGPAFETSELSWRLKFSSKDLKSKPIRMAV